MIVAAAGIDWLFIDTERGAVGVDEAAQVSTGPLSQGVTPIVRN
jgi:2-keto-3-deoxy-L-rhamnonate aldolase RhmA